MNLHMDFGQIPELRNLSSTERRQVYTECIHPMLMRWPVRIVRLTFMIALYMGAIRMRMWDSVAGFICFVITCLIADYLFDLALVSCMRSQLRKSMMQRRIGKITQGETVGAQNP